MASPTFGGKAARTLDFDIEARPLTYLGSDFTTREVTAIAAQFLDEPTPYVWLLGQDDPVDMLEGFRVLYDNADIVTGHYIRGYDLPTLNAAYLENDLPGLDPKWSVDTKNDLLKRQGISASQESLAGMLGIESPKVQMDQTKWRAANRLTPEGLAYVRERAVGDITQHMEMLAELRRRGWLGPGKTWSPSPGPSGRYTG